MTRPATAAQPTAPATARPSRLVATLLLIALLAAVIGSLGAPLITSVSTTLHVSLAAAQWTLTITLLTGAVTTPVLGRLGSGPRRRATVLATLAVVVAGSLLTVLPLPFGWLLAGRAAQGCGLGLTALMMGAARDHLDKDRAARAIAMISVASTVGIGIGYPLSGLLTDLAGIRAAYALGLAGTVAAFALAAAGFPALPPERTPWPDLTGSLLLGAGLTLLLLAISDTELWNQHTALAVALPIGALVLLAGWVVRERTAAAPLVDLRVLRHPMVAGANLAMFIAGAGMYLLLTLITRYMQTPVSAGYGFGVSTFVAGLVLVPFSVMGFLAGRAGPHVRKRVGATGLLCASTAVVLLGFVVFAVARGHFAEPVIAMTILGLGVGGFSAAMPAVILAAAPPAETASSMGFNQVVRATGFSLGSALGGLILSAATPAGHLFPTEDGYSTAAWAGAAITLLALGICLALGRRAFRSGTR